MSVTIVSYKKPDPSYTPQVTHFYDPYYETDVVCVDLPCHRIHLNADLVKQIMDGIKANPAFH